MAQSAEGATVKPYENFDAKKDAITLKAALKGIGCSFVSSLLGADADEIIEILAYRNNDQRVEISNAFKQMYGLDLIDVLKREFGGDFENVLVGLMTPSKDYLATQLNKAMRGPGTDEDALIDILCTSSNEEVRIIKEAYQRLYGKPLEVDIRDDTSGHFRRLLVSICNASRSEAPADYAIAREQAEELIKAGIGQWGVNASAFNSILAAESFEQLEETFRVYSQLTGHTITEAIKNELSGDTRDGMLAIVLSIENKPAYFASRLYKAMKGLGTDDNTLIRIVVSRSETDMVQIKREYEKMYGKSLEDAIADDTSGTYCKILMELLTEY